MTNVDSILKSKDIPLPTKVLIVKAMVFPVVMYECESWTINKTECWRIDAIQVVLEKTLESPLVSKEIKPVHPKGNQTLNIHWKDWCWNSDTLAIERRLIGKDPDAGKDWREEEKWMTEDEMVGWHHRFSGHEFEQTLGDSDREAWHAAVHGVSKSKTRLSNWTTTMVSLRTAMVLVGTFFSMLVYYNKCIMKVKAHRKSNLWPSWTYLVLTISWHVLYLCHSFKCALPSPLLFHLVWEKVRLLLSLN